MKLVIVRHGQSVANAENRWQGQMDYPLSKQGYKESESLKNKFETENIISVKRKAKCKFKVINVIV